MAFPSFGSIFGSRFARAFGRSGGSSIANLYRLLDQFNTPRSAGSVNGTQAEPTGQTRTVTDGNNKLNISSGKVNVATGGVGFADPRLSYPTLPRQRGLTLLVDVVLVNQTVLCGWGTTPSSVVTQIELFTTGLIAQDNGVAITVGAGSVLSTPYKEAIGLRTSGAWYWIKGGIYTFWNLIWISSLVSSDLLPTFMNATNVSAYTLDNIDVSNTLYVPTPLAYDTFTRADGALGSTETTGPDSQVVTALTWLFTSGKWAIVTNKAVATPTQGSDVVVNGTFSADTDWTKGAGWAIAAGLATATTASSNLTATVAPLTNGVWYQSQYTLSAFAAGTVRARLGGTNCPTRNVNGTYTETQRAGGTSLVAVGSGFTGSLDNWSVKALTLKDLFASLVLSTADVWAYVNITLENATSGKQAGLVLNLDSDSAPANFIIVYLDGAGNILVDECVAGVYANKLAATAITYSAGATLAVMRSGTELRVFYNNLAVGGAVTMTANTNLKHGLFSTSPLNSLDNALFMARGTGGEYEAALNALLAA
jgi:hypothetical protein